jgi:hypothetical protein
VSDSTGNFFGWDVSPSPSEMDGSREELSFSLDGDILTGQENQPVVRWSLDLPQDAWQAGLTLEIAERQARSLQAALEQAGGKLDDLSLEIALEVTEAAGRPEAVSYALLAGSPESRSLNELRDWLEGLTRLVTCLAWVETTLEGRPLGRTVVSWSGDMKTTWAPGLPPAQVDLHSRSLKAALVSRLALVRIASLTMQTAMRAAALAALPAGALWALPGAWKAVAQLIGELQQYKTIQTKI